MTDHHHIDPRAYPASLDAERAILGAIITDNGCLGRACEEGLDAAMFWRQEHGALFEMLLQREAKGLPSDVMLLAEAVTHDPEDPGADRHAAKGSVRYGGLAYIVDLPDYCVSTTNVRHYARIVIDHWRRRELLQAATVATDAALVAQADPTELAADLMSRVMAGPLTKTGGFRPMWQILDETIDATEQAHAAPERFGGISTGYRDIDRHIGRLHPADLIVLAARPGMGKTALALNICEAVATDRHAPNGCRNVAMFSLEMTGKQLGRRSLSAAAQVSSLGMRTGTISPEELDRVQRAHEAQRERFTSLYVDDQGGLTVSQIVSRSRRLRQQVGDLDLIAIDYLQLIQPDRALLRSSREVQVAHMSGTLKQLAKDLGCPVLCLAQLNRGVESRADKRPILSDLRESGAVEQDADAVLFVFRGEYYWPDDPKMRNKAEIIVAKARHGKNGVVDLNFYAHLTRFTDFTIHQLQFGGRQ